MWWSRALAFSSLAQSSVVHENFPNMSHGRIETYLLTINKELFWFCLFVLLLLFLFFWLEMCVFFLPPTNKSIDKKGSTFLIEPKKRGRIVLREKLKKLMRQRKCNKGNGRWRSHSGLDLPLLLRFCFFCFFSSRKKNTPKKRFDLHFLKNVFILVKK